MSNVIYITGTEQFKKEVLEYNGVVLADFRAERCGPCRMLGPIIDELSIDYAGKNVKFVKINVDENPDLAGSFQIMSIPAVFLLNAGKPVDSIVGVRPKQFYQEKIDPLLVSPTQE
ncbi:MAG: thioredoxin domain-containing protein [Candidatus Absconditicoccaceae bacterium]